MSIWFFIFDTSIIWGYLGSLNWQLWGCQAVYLKIPYSSGGLGDKKGTSCMQSGGGGLRTESLLPYKTVYRAALSTGAL